VGGGNPVTPVTNAPTTRGTDVTPTTTEQQVRTALTDVDFPADRDQLVTTAERNGADHDTVRSLRSIPPVDYGNLDEVLASVTTP
jgi:hypothetical protein